jgi:hypothetical protein
MKKSDFSPLRSPSVRPPPLPKKVFLEELNKTEMGLPMFGPRTQRVMWMAALLFARMMSFY